MNNLISKLTVSVLLIMSLIASGDTKTEQKNESKSPKDGYAVIIVESKTFELPIQACHEPRTNTYEGETVTNYSIIAFDSKLNIKLSIYGTQDDDGKDSHYLVEFDGGFLSNGTSYSEEMPFEIFDSKTLSFKGKTEAKKKKSKDKTEKTIEITVTC